MRWSFLAFCGLLFTNVVSFGQRPPAGQPPSAAPSAADAGFFATSGVARFQLIQGRLCLDAPRHRKGSQRHKTDHVYESVTVTAERGIPSLHYVYQAADHHLTLSVQQAYFVRIESWLPQTDERSVLEQPARGQIRWKVSRGEIQDQHEGATLLHTRMSDQASFDLHHGILLKRLLRGRSMAGLHQEVQEAVFDKLGHNSRVPTREDIETCIEDLRANQRATRTAAQRQLLAWGTPVIATLQSLDPDQLDAEQQQRIRCILKQLRPRTDDTPATLAKLFMNDQAYWQALAQTLPPNQIQLANQHLLQFGGSQLVIEPRPTHRIAGRDPSID